MHQHHVARSQKQHFETRVDATSAVCCSLRCLVTAQSLGAPTHQSLLYELCPLQLRFDPQAATALFSVALALTTAVQSTCRHQHVVNLLWPWTLSDRFSGAVMIENVCRRVRTVTHDRARESYRVLLSH